MSLADLKRLIQRATPRVEDVRSPDRTDFIRREHGHLTIREVIDALDALEFSIETFASRMRELLASEEAAGLAEETAVHGLFRTVEGLRLLPPVAPAAPEAAPAASGDAVVEAAEEAAEGWEERLAEARGKGADCFKAKDFAAAAEHYAQAIREAPRTHAELHTLHSNRSAALLQLGQVEAALADAKRCVALAPTWPKGRFREGSCLRQLGRHVEALRAFGEGRALEPKNEDWEREMDKTERLLWQRPDALARQLVLRLLPELLRAWLRSGGAGGVLHLQVNAELKEAGVPKWRLVREGKSEPKAQIRYAFLSRKEHLANLAANLQGAAPEGVATVDIGERKLSIAEVGSFLDGGGDTCARVHVDVKDGAKRMVAFLVQLPCDERTRGYVGDHKDPPAPKGSVDAVMAIQRKSGFPKALPSLLGFQSFPGDLNFPVVDVKRDMPDASSGS